MTVTMSPLILRELVITGMKAVLTGADIEAHKGLFDLKALQRYGAKAPAVRVCVTGTGRMARQSSGDWSLPVHLVAVIVTKDFPAADRDTAALSLLSAMLVLVAGNRWGRDSDIRPPENIDSKNEYDEAIDKAGLAVWQVMWTQDIAVGDDLESETGQWTGADLLETVTIGAPDVLDHPFEVAA